MEKRGGQSRQEAFNSSQNPSNNSHTENSQQGFKPPQKSRFAYLGHGEPPKPLTLQEQLWHLYGTSESADTFDGTLQHQIAESIKQREEDGDKEW